MHDGRHESDVQQRLEALREGWTIQVSPVELSSPFASADGAATDGASSTKLLPPRRRRRRRGRGGLFLVFQIPALVLFVVFVGYPIVDSIYLAFFSWTGVGAPVYAGLSNFTTFFKSPDFVPALEHSLLIAFGTTICSTLIGILIAGYIHFRLPGRRIVRTACFLPVIVPLTMSATFWAVAFQPYGGMVNTVLGELGLGSNHLWLASPKTALLVIIFVAVWSGSGFSMIVALAAMESLETEVDEAAVVDGAGTIRHFWSVTVPSTRRIILLIGLLGLIFNFKLFAIVWTLTAGGPGNATHIFPTLVYKEAFIVDEFGYASAISVVSFLITLALIGLYVTVLRPFKSEAR